ncbi:hypothetical protein EYC59_01150 [Candidatus Saccharibacteria bacterium]|nr:MAG: hypothetical protein EYC59_01150 [Candidatus Saccharibacteria bacterium]
MGKSTDPRKQPKFPVGLSDERLVAGKGHPVWDRLGHRQDTAPVYPRGLGALSTEAAIRHVLSADPDPDIGEAARFVLGIDSIPDAS